MGRNGDWIPNFTHMDDGATSFVSPQPILPMMRELLRFATPNDF
jgi:hypothetical protein